MAEPKYKITITSGERAGVEFDLGNKSCTIGRGDDVDISLPNDDFVSRRHAEIQPTANGPVFVNHSANGSTVNGAPPTNTPLVAGDTIGIGANYKLSVSVSAGGSRRSAAPAARAAEPTTKQQPGKVARKSAGKKRIVSPLLVAYLVAMAIAFVFLATYDGSPRGRSLQEVKQVERAYAAEHKLDEKSTERVLQLLDLAQVHERQGRRRMARETYREVFGLRQPDHTDSPAFRYAIRRIGKLAPSK